jgi:hypothetical protein
VFVSFLLVDSGSGRTIGRRRWCGRAAPAALDSNQLRGRLRLDTTAIATALTLQRLVPTLDLVPGHRVVWSSADVGHVVAFHPFHQVVGDV